jgi:hypothetical protein
MHKFAHGLVPQITQKVHAGALGAQFLAGRQICDCALLRQQTLQQ